MRANRRRSRRPRCLRCCSWASGSTTSSRSRARRRSRSPPRACLRASATTTRRAGSPVRPTSLGQLRGHAARHQRFPAARRAGLPGRGAQSAADDHHPAAAVGHAACDRRAGVDHDPGDRRPADLRLLHRGRRAAAGARVDRSGHHHRHADDPRVLPVRRPRARRDRALGHARLRPPGGPGSRRGSSTRSRRIPRCRARSSCCARPWCRKSGRRRPARSRAGPPARARVAPSPSRRARRRSRRSRGPRRSRAARPNSASTDCRSGRFRVCVRYGGATAHEPSDGRTHRSVRHQGHPAAVAQAGRAVPRPGGGRGDLRRHRARDRARRRAAVRRARARARGRARTWARSTSSAAWRDSARSPRRPWARSR